MQTQLGRPCFILYTKTTSVQKRLLFTYFHFFWDNPTSRRMNACHLNLNFKYSSSPGLTYNVITAYSDGTGEALRSMTRGREEAQWETLQLYNSGKWWEPNFWMNKKSVEVLEQIMGSPVLTYSTGSAHMHAYLLTTALFLERKHRDDTVFHQISSPVNQMGANT